MATFTGREGNRLAADVLGEDEVSWTADEALAVARFELENS